MKERKKRKKRNTHGEVHYRVLHIWKERERERERERESKRTTLDIYNLLRRSQETHPSPNKEIHDRHFLDLRMISSILLSVKKLAKKVLCNFLLFIMQQQQQQ